MSTQASENGTAKAEMEFEAAHYSHPEMEDEWEMHESNPYANPFSHSEMEDEWEMHESNPYANPFSHPEMEDEWEMHGSNPYANPFSHPEMEDEWEMHEANPYSQSFSHPEMEDEWEMHESNPYANPFSHPEMEDEWEMHESNPYSQSFSHPDREAEFGRWISSIKRAVSGVLPQAKSMAMRIGGDLLKRVGHNNPQIGSLLQQLKKLLAQAESETAAHEAHLFGTNEYEAEVATHQTAHEAALTEVMAAEASHTESESEAQALLGATIPLSIRVMGGKIGLRRITPTLVRVNAQLVLNLHRRGRTGRQLLRTVPAIQRRTLATLNTIQRTGQPITPEVTRQVMAGQTARVLGTPHICGAALARNMAIRNSTVAPARPTPTRKGTS